ncbi:MAG: ComEC/Rec2 family competence protein [Candidatus Daviesbacteria bacterium]|nr:ComEC/Rec2 family competence protein [Candidatus Daviesbacteria bacterium]
MYKINFPIILAIVLYLLIYFLRWQQGGWDIKLNLLVEERQALDQISQNLLPSPQAELLSGIVLGQKKELPPELRLALRDTSTLHIVVVSGQNLTLLAGLILRLSGLLSVRVAIGLTVLVIAGYTMLTGAELPVLRAAAMAGLSYLAQLTGRLADGFRVLLITAGGFLLVNPSWITDLSFQLSFLATFGVIVVAPMLSQRLNSWPVFLRENLTVTLSAQLMVTPIIAANFHQISLVGLATNLFVLWTTSYIMILGMITLLAGVLIPFIAQILAIGLNILLTYFIYVVRFFSILPFAWEYVGEQVWVVWVGYYLVVGGLLIAINKLKVQS